MPYKNKDFKYFIQDTRYCGYLIKIYIFNSLKKMFLLFTSKKHILIITILMCIIYIYIHKYVHIYITVSECHTFLGFVMSLYPCCIILISHTSVSILHNLYLTEGHSDYFFFVVNANNELNCKSEVRHPFL